MAWRAARSLPVLHAQLKTGSRAGPPATDPNAWGMWGDPDHQGTTSDHNPRDFPGWGDDVVTAADFPHAPALGLDARRVLDDIRRSRDPRVKYGISNGEMFSSYPTSAYPAWTWRPYGGSDGHFTHGHLSVVGDARADGTQPWQTIGADDMSWDETIGAGYAPSSGYTQHKFRTAAGYTWAGVDKANTKLDTLAGQVTALTSVVNQLGAALAAGGGSVDTAAILAGVDERLAVLAAKQRDAVADLGEGGAAQVRADV